MIYNHNTEECGSKSLMALGPKIWNALPGNIKNKHLLANSKNILNRCQVRLANAKFALVFRNYEKLLVFRHLRTFEKQSRK